MKRTIITAGLMFITLLGSIYSQENRVWSLEECIQYAWEKNIQIQKGGLATLRAEINSEQSKSQRFPSLSASASHNFNWSKSNTSGSGILSGMNGSSYSLSSGVTLFNTGKLTNLIKQSELNIENSKYSLETIKESITLSILNAYLQILYAEEQVNNSRKQIEATEGQLRLAEERLRLRVISQADYAQVKSQLASEKLTLANAESQLAIAKVNLMQLMELPVTDSFRIARPELPEPLNKNIIPDVRVVYETALKVKPQVKTAEINKEIAAIDEKIAKAGYYPVLSASAGISTSYSSAMDESYFSQINDGIRPSVGFSLSIPVYQKSQVKTSVKLAEVSYRDAELSEINIRNELRKSIEQACQDVVSAQSEYEASLESYNAAVESSALADEKFMQGLINSVDYMVSKTSLIVAESRLLQSKYNLIFSYKVLDFYMGIPISL